MTKWASVTLAHNKHHMKKITSPFNSALSLCTKFQFSTSYSFLFLSYRPFYVGAWHGLVILTFQHNIALPVMLQETVLSNLNLLQLLVLAL